MEHGESAEATPSQYFEPRLLEAITKESLGKNQVWDGHRCFGPKLQQNQVFPPLKTIDLSRVRSHVLAPGFQPCMFYGFNLFYPQQPPSYRFGPSQARNPSTGFGGARLLDPGPSGPSVWRSFSSSREANGRDLGVEVGEVGRQPISLIEMASNLMEMASNPIEMASNLIEMASNLMEMASNLVDSCTVYIFCLSGVTCRGVVKFHPGVISACDSTPTSSVRSAPQYGTTGTCFGNEWEWECSHERHSGNAGEVGVVWTRSGIFATATRTCPMGAQWKAREAIESIW